MLCYLNAPSVFFAVCGVPTINAIGVDDSDAHIGNVKSDVVICLKNCLRVGGCLLLLWGQ